MIRNNVSTRSYALSPVRLYLKEIISDRKMALLKTSIFKISSFGLAVFILLFLVYPESIAKYYKTVETLKRQPPQKHHRFSDIENRMIQDNKNIKKMCSKYLSTASPKIPKGQNIKIAQYHMNKEKKLGWCINAKVN